MSTLSSRIILVGVAACGCLAAQIRLSVTTSPSSLQINESGRVLITLTNTNAVANASVHRGDVLQIYLNLGDAAILALDGTILLGGRGFQDREWTFDASAGTNPISLVIKARTAFGRP